MKVLVAYASKTGFTKGIAEFLGERFRQRGIEADVAEVAGAKDLSQYDAFVVGSALYMFHWMKEARSFVMQNRSALRSRPLWLFSSGPVGTSRVNSKGEDLLDVSGPKELDELREAVGPRDHRVFFGGLDGSKLTGATGLMYRLVSRSKAARESMPDGDYRDWGEIGRWAEDISDALSSVGRRT